MELGRDFKGIWIPRELWLSKDLSIMEKSLLLEIDSLSQGEQGCFASDEYLAAFTGLSKGRLKNILTGLRKRDYVKTTAFNGRKRILKVNVTKLGLQRSRKRDSRGHENVTIDKSIDKSIEKEKVVLQKESVPIPPELQNLELYRDDKKLLKAWPKLRAAWAEAFPRVNIKAEVAAAYAWEMADPSRRKTQRGRFLNGWMSRVKVEPTAQEIYDEGYTMTPEQIEEAQELENRLAKAGEGGYEPGGPRASELPADWVYSTAHGHTPAK